MLRFTENPSGIRIGGVTPGGIATSAGKIWPPDGAPAAAYATIAVTVARLAAQDLNGFSAPHSVGAVNPATFTFEDGNTSNIRQLGNTASAGQGVTTRGVRFHVDAIAPPLNPNPAPASEAEALTYLSSVFPDRMRASRGDDAVVLTPRMADGNWRLLLGNRSFLDYQPLANADIATLNRIFTVGETVTVELFYD